MPPYPRFWAALWLSLTIYWCLPRRWRMGFLAAASFFLALILDTSSAFTLAGLAVVFYLVAPTAEAPLRRGRTLLTMLIVGVLGYLAFFKYLPDLVTHWSPGSPLASVVVPLGISYFTFKLIHYAVERRRGTLPTHGIVDFFVYLLLFPIFTAGPIERFDHFLAHRKIEWEWRFLTEGLTRIIHGLIKRFALIEVVLPGMFGELPGVNDLLGRLAQASPLEVWYLVVMTYLYAYLDFSAYADIAIGASRLFGIEIMENFNFPILAQNIADFWRRWHMTLAGWCQSYVYMPLIGLTRNPYVAVYATFITIGLWHGGKLQWLAWGAYHATGIAIYVTWRRTKLRKKTVGWQWLGYPLTFLYVAAGYSLTVTLGQATFYDSLRIMAKLFGIDFPAIGSAGG